MLERFDRYLKVIWDEYKGLGVLVAIGVVVGLIWLSGIDVAAIVNRSLGL
jgi:hypothetical protein